MSASREYAKFKREFVGPILTRKQRIALMPSMPADKPLYVRGLRTSARQQRIALMPSMPAEKLSHVSKYKLIPLEDLSPEDRKRALWSAYIVERRKKRDKSMPPWANKKVINAIYLIASQLTIETGIKHEVDHVIPSNHELICGLHVETNLQILTEAENIAKSNSFDV